MFPATLMAFTTPYLHNTNGFHNSIFAAPIFHRIQFAPSMMEQIEKPRRKPTEHKGSLKHTGGKTLNSIVFKNKDYIYRKLIN